MDLHEANVYVNDILFEIDRVADLADPKMVARAAEGMINRRYFTHPVEEYAEALNVVLREGRIPSYILELVTRHSEADLLDFLARLARQLEELRPWPRPRVTKLDIEQWSSFGNAKAIARIDRPMMEIIGLLNRRFDEVLIGTGQLPLMVLELRSGDVVALMGSVDLRSTVFTLLQRDAGDSAAIIARFIEYTGFSPADVTPLAESASP